MREGVPTLKVNFTVKIDSKTKTVSRNKEGHFILVKGTIHQDRTKKKQKTKKQLGKYMHLTTKPKMNEAKNGRNWRNR